jgi:hypothetical protein
MRWAAVVVLAGCWSNEQKVEPPQPIENAQPAPPSRQKESVWTGRYVCAQGPTAVTITLEHEGMELAGTFEFSALPENPSVPHGKYTLVGSSTNSGDDVTVTLKPVEWIEHPGNYVMVGVVAHIDRERRLLTGTMTNPSCSTISLERVR